MHKLLNIPDQSIIICPGSGLSNRLLSMSTMLSVTKTLNKRLCIAWLANVHGCTASFQSLFEIPQSLHLTRFTHAGFLPWAYINVFNTKIPFKRLQHLARKINNKVAYDVFIKRYYELLPRLADRDIHPGRDYRENQGFIERHDFSENRIYVHNTLIFSYNTEYINLSYLRPVKQIRQKIDAVKSRMDKKHVIGVHIRHQNREAHFHNNPIESFIDCMRYEISKNHKTQFFVATDSPSMKTILRNIFPDRIIDYSAECGRSSLQQIQDAVVDLYALGNTNKIIGTYGSTFSLQAALINNLPLQFVEKDGYTKTRNAVDSFKSIARMPATIVHK